MATKKKVQNRRGNNDDDANKLSKEDEALAEFIRFNTPYKQSTCDGHEVEYFIGSKAVDVIMDSKKYGPKAKEPRFVNREQANRFMVYLIEQGFFFRAKVLVPRPKNKGKPASDEKVKDSPRVRKIKEENEKAEKADESGKDNDTANETESEQKKDEPEKKKKKIKLIPHDIQRFNDDSDVYVWIFNPTPLYKKIIGIGILLAVIAGCLFPLWPDWTKTGVYYLSMAGIAFFASILGIGFARTILFGIIYVVTMGKHRFWFLPNILADVGFFESFVPVYTYEYCPDGISTSNKKKDKKKDKKETEEQSESPKATKSKAKKDKVEKEEEKEKPEESGDHSETDPEEKYSNPSSDEEEDSEGQEEVAESTPSTNGSEPVDIQAEEEEQQAQDVPTAESPKSKALRKRRNVRKTDDDGFVMVGDDE